MAPSPPAFLDNARKRMTMDDYVIRSYSGEDEAPLLSLWKQVMYLDPVSPSVFRTKVLMDLNFNPAGLLVVQIKDDLVGFVFSITRQVPLFLDGLQPEQGWITAFGVHPAHRRKGVGKRLFTAALERLREMRCKQVWISPYTPNYFIPGVDVNGYPEAVAFLQHTGWMLRNQPISMQVNLNGFIIPDSVLKLEQQLVQQGIAIHPIRSSDLPDLFPFIRENFGWDWVRHAQDYLLELMGRGTDDIVFLVARHEEKLVGYCQQRGERFGPFGVTPGMRNRGIGRVLLFKCLAEMASRAFHCAWFLWTDEDAARLYASAGFKKVRQFAVMEYTLTQVATK
jgi:mycothiol synthase